MENNNDNIFVENETIEVTPVENIEALELDPNAVEVVSNEEISFFETKKGKLLITGIGLLVGYSVNKLIKNWPNIKTRIQVAQIKHNNKVIEKKMEQNEKMIKKNDKLEVEIPHPNEVTVSVVEN